MLARELVSRVARHARGAVVARAMSTAAADTIPALLKKNAADLPFSTAVKAPHWEYEWTNKKLQEAVVKIAAGMDEAELRAGDTMVIWSDESFFPFSLTLAAAHLGIHLHFLDPASIDPVHIVDTLKATNARAFVYDPEYEGVNRHNIVRLMLPDFPDTDETDVYQSLRLPNLRRILHTGYEPVHNIFGVMELPHHTPDLHPKSRFSRLLDSAPTSAPLVTPVDYGRAMTQADLLQASRELAKQLGVKQGDAVLQAAQGGYGTLASLAAYALPAACGVRLVFSEMHNLRFGVGQAIDLLAVDKIPAAILPSAEAVAKIAEFQRGEGRSYERARKRGMRVYESHRSLPTFKAGVIVKGDAPAQLGAVTLRPAKAFVPATKA